jgi:beta-1,4-mannosyl-glycoprotein beta-1,4-N-acetylglucosaminyltransferase
MSKVIDTILYYDEDLIIDLRMNILDNHVNYFVILECNYDFNGNYKGFNFKINKFNNFINKIIYIKLDLSDKINLIKKDSWYVHDKSRDEIMNYLDFASGEDVIIHSDADEIPNLNNIDLNNLKNKIYVFEQKIYYFKFNLQDTTHMWTKSKMCKFKILKSFSKLRWLKGKKYNFYRIDTFFKKNHSLNVSIVKNGGWHFTYIKTLDDIAKKLNSVVEKEHTNYTINFIKSQIDQKINFLHRDLTKLVKQEVNNEFPKYLIENLSKYEKFIA